MTTQTNSQSARIIRLRDVINRVGLCRATIYNLIKKGDFPQQVNLGLNSVGWIESEVQTWIDNRISASRSSQAA